MDAAEAADRLGFSNGYDEQEQQAFYKICDDARAKLERAVAKAKIKPSARLAAQTTIDAMMYSLRSGTTVLSRDDVRARLADIAEAQLLEMIVLLQKRDGRIAPRWSDDEIEQLMQTWTACHE
jgi:hypothetical protein